MKYGASWCNLTDDVTTCPMMTSLCVIELLMFGLVEILNVLIDKMVCKS